MGESVCLLRSFSQPEMRETNEVFPHRVLTESVSFGRFASEPLEWEKWSAFTQNRYLEEVERFTKPGSVAQKKAFFEAHFKNRAAARATEKKIEQVNAITSVEILKDNLVDLEVPRVVNNGMAMDEVRHGEVSKTEVESVAPSFSVIDETTDVQIGEVKVTNVESFNSMAALSEENSTSMSIEKRSSSSRSKSCSRSSKLETSFVTGPDPSLKKTRKEPPSSSKKSTSVSKNQNRSPFERLHMSTRCATSGNTDKDIVKIPQNGSRSRTNTKGSGKADKREISGPSSVHMSYNFASSNRQPNETAPKKLARSSTAQETISSNARSSAFPKGNEPTGASKRRKRPLPPTAKEGSDAVPTSTSAVRLPELCPPNNQLSEDNRINITKGSSVSCRIPNNVQRQPSACSDYHKTRSRTRAKSCTVSSPFSFRSDERAEKRKEFFKKLEEKNKKEDPVKDKLSYGFKANQNTHLSSEEHKNPQVGSFQVPLISLTSPRFHKNRTPGKENIKRSDQAPHKVVSVKTINTRNASIDKYKCRKIHPSSGPQTNKKSQENSSPNILQN